MGVLLVIHAGSHNTLSVFTTKYTPPGFHGLSGVVAGSVFSILAFGGFEGAAPLAEEARNPRRTIQLAVLIATLAIGALYVFTTYAADVAFGPSGFASFTTGTGPRSTRSCWARRSRWRRCSVSACTTVRPKHSRWWVPR